MMKVRDWHTNLGWAISGLFATGAFWYFLSKDSYCLASISAVVAVLFAGFTIVLHRLKDGDSGTNAHSKIDNAFQYAPFGRYGKNILSNQTHDVRVGEELSLQANIPKDSHLHIRLSGLPPIYLSDGGAGWSFSIVGIQGWKNSIYRQSTTGGEQHFDADSGAADLNISLAREGQLEISAFEGNSQIPTWQRKISVHAA